MNFRSWVTVAAFVGLTIAIAPNREETVTIKIVAMSLKDQKVVNVAKKALEDRLHVKVLVGETSSLPQLAYYAPRNRYRASKILDYINKAYGGDASVILGLTSSDISITNGEHKDWGVFGLGQVNGKACVVSSFRLSKPGKKDKDQLLGEIVVHEVGHCLGLSHCTTSKCIMYDAKGKLAIVEESNGEFCRLCKGDLKDVARK